MAQKAVGVVDSDVANVTVKASLFDTADDFGCADFGLEFDVMVALAQPGTSWGKRIAVLPFRAAGCFTGADFFLARFFFCALAFDSTSLERRYVPGFPLDIATVRCHSCDVDERTAVCFQNSCWRAQFAVFFDVTLIDETSFHMPVGSE